MFIHTWTCALIPALPKREGGETTATMADERCGAWVGPAMVLLGSALFAVANAFGKSFEQTGGTVGTMMFVRGLLSWGFNGLLARCSAGEPLLTVLLFRGVLGRLGPRLLLNGVLNAICVQLLFIALDSLVSFADTFVIVIGVYTCAVFVLSVLLGRSESVTPLEFVGGSLTVIGVALVSQPSWLFGGIGARPVSPLGVFLLVIAGTSVGASIVGFRALTQDGATPAQCNSALQGVLGGYSLATLGLCNVVTGGAPPHWSQIRPPESALALLLLLAYISCITLAQLLFIHGIKLVRSGTAAVLGNLEIVFASLIGFTVLGQPTNLLSVLGNLLVFGGASLVAYGAAHERPDATQQQVIEAQLRYETRPCCASRPLTE